MFRCLLRGRCGRWLERWWWSTGTSSSFASRILVLECLFIHSSVELQLLRLMLRDNSSREDASSRLNSQLPIAEKVKYADIVIDNSGTRQELEAHVDALVRRLEQDAGWTWRLSWVLPLFMIVSAAVTLLWRTVRRRVKDSRRGKKD